MKKKLLFVLCCVLAISSQLLAQEIQVTGTVISGEDDTGLPGVNVLVKGTTIGAVTDINGAYSLQVSSSESVLVFSSVGFITEEVQVGNRTVIDVTLSPDITALSEIVVVGYGTQEKGVVTGAISSLDMASVESIPVTSITETFGGRIPGVYTSQSGGGAPGGAVQVSVRGIGTINAEQPLYVIDGIPVQEGGLQDDSFSFMNQLNPNDIESIDVLKDASAAAIYGNRAANGVVIITTKRGKAGPVRINFDAYYGTQQPFGRYDVLNADQYTQYLQDLHSQPDGQIPTAYENGGRPRPGVDTDWQDEMFNSAPIQNYNLGISGGKENALFSLGFEYFNQEGTIVGSGFERFNLRANSDFKIGKRITIGQTLLLSKSYRTTTSGSGGRRPQEHAIKQSPNVPVLDDTFLGGYGHPDTDEGQDARNPIADANLYTRDQDRWRVWAAVNASWEIVDGLTYKIQAGVDFAYQNNFNYNPRFEQVRRLIEPSSINRSRSEFFSPLFEQYLTYAKQFGQHNFSAMVGFSAQENNWSQIGVQGSQLPDNVVSVDAAAANQIPSENGNETALRSLFGRITYDYAQKYLLTANIRRDETSKLFRGTNPTGIFPSVSAGWRISEEDFMANVTWISNLKLKAGYGEVGNQTPLSAYPTDVNLSSNLWYILGGATAVQGINQQELANPNLKWETLKETNVGIETGFMNERIQWNLDYFKRNTTDLIWRQQVPPSVGLSSPFVNGGEVQNEGFETMLTYRKTKGDFTFDITGTYTAIQNEVISLNNDELIIKRGSATDDISNVSWTQVGESIGTFYGWQSAGVFRNWDEVYNHAYINQATTGDDENGDGIPDYDTDARDAGTATTNTAPGDVKWIDQDGDGDVDNDDQVALGSPIPKSVYGLSFNAAFKNFDLTLFVQGASGHSIYNSAKRWLVDFRQNFNNGIEATNSAPYSADYSASEPRIVRADPNRNVLRSSDRYVFDGSYARIQNLTIGYSFNDAVLDKLSASRFRIYFTARNLATFTNYFGLEPDVGSLDTGTALDAGIDRLIYPQPRTFIFGLQLAW